jgi:hypothetical protein
MTMIGKPKRVYTVEPLESPVPQERPPEQPKPVETPAQPALPSPVTGAAV